MALDYGYLLKAAQAKPILAAAGIGPYDDVGEGRGFEYGGTLYWILQTGVRFPNATEHSPDGWHLVYTPSKAEADLGKPPADFMEQLKTLALYAVGALAIVALIFYLARRT